MVLALGLRPGAEQEIDALINEQTDPSSPLFHKFLTPDEFENRFGMSDDDLNIITGWLTSHGFAVEEVGKGRRWINFSGTAAQVERAFHTEMHKYRVNGELHHANATPPAIPRALEGVVKGIVSLHDFPTKSSANRTFPDNPTSTHALAPMDFAKIYNSKPILDLGIDGAGVSIAIPGRSLISPDDIVAFRKYFNLPSASWSMNVPFSQTVTVAGLKVGGSFQIIGVPGIPVNQFTKNDSEGEGLLDIEWAGAAAPGATIKYVVGPGYPGPYNLASGNPVQLTSGDVLAAQYIVQKNLANIVSMSYSACESAARINIPTTPATQQFLSVGTSVPSTFAQFYNALWQQAAAQGMTVFVSSGDSGSSGCSAPAATMGDPEGMGVNVICSTPYNTCIGGTQFNDTAANWGAEDPIDHSSVSGSRFSCFLCSFNPYYTPEVAWNESPGNVKDPVYHAVIGTGLWATGGGVSTVVTQPWWQTYSWFIHPLNIKIKQPVKGMPEGAWRHVPDVSLNAAGHTPYLIWKDGHLEDWRGTSLATPAFAGIIALIEQHYRTNLGTVNSQLYHLANRQAYEPNVAPVNLFNDITQGNNWVPYPAGSFCQFFVASGPCVAGYSAAPGYDQATGLGSVNAKALYDYFFSF